MSLPFNCSITLIEVDFPQAKDREEEIKDENDGKMTKPPLNCHSLSSCCRAKQPQNFLPVVAIAAWSNRHLPMLH